MAKEITARSEDYSQWYNDIVRKADLADYSEVRGCMIIKPYGYAIWEKMRDELDKKLKETGHQNAYFPLFIPKSFLSREAKHVEGFAKECAVVTHHRLKNDPQSGEVIVDPEAKLEEELIVRPTSETIIWNTYKDWIQSYRDLPLLINQWANVVRWELRTRLFLRTSEFLWQEGHTAHATREEAIQEAELIHNIYTSLAENFLGIPVIRGIKTENERFAGAEETYTIEALMQDGKALQLGTSHFLGQNFAKAFDVTYLDDNNERQFVWATSWGVTTRLIGALIMNHSDDRGLVLPPAVAPVQVIFIPVPKPSEEVRDKILHIKQKLEQKGIRTDYDNDKRNRPGFKFAEYEMKGIPVRIALGPRDIKNNQMEVARRDTGEKQFISMDDAETAIPKLLEEIQENLLTRSRRRVNNNTVAVDSFEEFENILEDRGGFISAHWDGSEETEIAIREKTKASIRCIPGDYGKEEGKCILTGRKSRGRVIFAKAY